MAKELFNFSQISQWLVEQYKIVRKYQQSQVNFLRIADILYSEKSKKPTFLIQLAEKNLFIKKSISELFESNTNLDAFSRQDIQKITETKTIWELSPKYRLLSHHDNGKSIEVSFEDEEGNLLTKDIYEISNDVVFLQKISSSHAHLLGYLLGIQDAKNGVKNKDV